MESFIVLFGGAAAIVTIVFVVRLSRRLGVDRERHLAALEKIAQTRVGQEHDHGQDGPVDEQGSEAL